MYNVYRLGITSETIVAAIALIVLAIADFHVSKEIGFKMKISRGKIKAYEHAVELINEYAKMNYPELLSTQNLPNTRPQR